MPSIMLTNLPTNNLLTFMKEELASCDSFFVLSGFITKQGLDTLTPQINRFLERKGKLTVVTGFFQTITDYDSLQLFLSWQQRYNVDINISTFRNFHAKMYMFVYENTIALSVGSSNLTPNGLSSRGEINTILQNINIDGGTAKLINETIEYHKDNSVPLTDEIADKYAQGKNALSKAYANGAENNAKFVLLDRILGAKSTIENQ